METAQEEPHQALPNQQPSTLESTTDQIQKQIPTNPADQPNPNNETAQKDVDSACEAILGLEEAKSHLKVDQLLEAAHSKFYIYFQPTSNLKENVVAYQAIYDLRKERLFYPGMLIMDTNSNKSFIVIHPIKLFDCSLNFSYCFQIPQPCEALGQ